MRRWRTKLNYSAFARRRHFFPLDIYNKSNSNFTLLLCLST